MKKFAFVATLTFGLAASVMAAEFKGFVQDEKCSTVAAMKNNAECSKKCIKEGTPAVLVGTDGKIYKIANQDKIVAHAGENVTIVGKANGNTITVDSVK